MYDDVWQFVVDGAWYGLSVALLLDVVTAPVGAAVEWMRRSFTG